MKTPAKSKSNQAMKATKKKPAKAGGPFARESNQKVVLLAVSGQSPAIITETVWKLANPDEGRKRVVPDDVVIITTTRGLADINRDLKNLDEQGKLKPLSGWGEKSVWQTLRETVLGPTATSDLRLQLSTPLIIELPNPGTGVKTPAPDLRTAADNVAAANFILEKLRGLLSPDVQVIASIAGGRKTMGCLLYACMSLLGRETDRVTHVLVQSPFDECRDFFFPSQPVKDLVAGREKRHVQADQALIELADIPFVPLINRFHDLGEVPGGFMGLARLYAAWLKRDALVPPEAAIQFEPAKLCVRVNDMSCKIEGRKAFEVLRFVFEANLKGWVNELNDRDFIVAAEFFKASRGVKPKLDAKDQEIHKPVAEEILKGFHGPPPAPWIGEIDSHKVSTALSVLRSFLRHKHSQWKPAERSWRLPSFRLVDT